jgi:tetratricopeptide (TPR) repeat protein
LQQNRSDLLAMVANKDLNKIPTRQFKRNELLICTAIAHHKKGRLKEANLVYKEILDKDPQNATALQLYGVLASQIKQYEHAIALLSRAILLEPDHVEALNNRGVVLKTMRRFDEALKDLDKAISLKSDYFDAYNNRGIVNRELGFFEEAISDYNKAISLNPDHAEAYNNRGNALKEMMRLDESLEDFNKAIALKPDYVDAHWNKSIHSLLLEDFQAGWPMYEWRLQREEWVVGSALKTNKPRWDGQRDKTVFLWAEQGVGDEIMFASLIPELQAISSSVIVQCDERLITLFKRSFTGPITYYANRSEVPQESYDFHLPIASLPLFFRFSRDDYKKASNPYLRCEKPEADLIRQKILDNKTNTLIGVSWKSSSKLPGAQHRNIELGSLAQKLTSPEVTLVNLQYGDVSEEIRALKESYNIEILEVPEIDKYNDIDGLASLITACHEVVSIDNATVHLAGALGAKTKALLPFNQDWRWGISHTGSYWYNSVKLLRQKRLGDWTETLSQI